VAAAVVAEVALAGKFINRSIFLDPNFFAAVP